MLNDYKINRLGKNDFNEILDLSNLLLGNNYLNTTLLQEYIINDYKTGFTIKNNHQVIGFQLIQVCSHKELTNLALTEKEWFTNQFLSYPIGVLKTIVIHPNYHHKGVGTALTQKCIKELSKSCRKIISICWNQQEATSFNFVLEKCGLQNLKEIKNFWKKDSLLKDYNCPICGDPPCVCSAYIYSY